VLRGAITSQQITQRMGLAPDEQEVVRQLILQHLRMVHISQRRDLDDPGVIREMANHVQDVALLRMLYILTYCDTKSVGPGVWTDWKAMLLYDLFRKTQLLLEGKDPIQPVSEDQIARIASQMEAAMGKEADAARIRDFAANAPPKYIASNTPARMARHLRMLEHLTPEDRIYWEAEEPPGMNYTEITAVSYDRPGFMSFVCGALSSKDVNILSVQVFSTKDGYAIDTFQVTDLHGNKLPHGFRLDRLRADLNEVLLGRATTLEKFPVRRPRRSPRPDVAAKKPEQVIITNDASPSYTVLEVKAYDRPGLLYGITTVCAEQGYYIHLAMITTEAYRVVDVFYLTDLEFNKLEPTQGKKLQAALEAVIA
jgi:[protein-PII] uridylyltransferase